MVVQLMDHTLALRKSHSALETRFDGLEKRFDGLEVRFDNLQREMASKHNEVVACLDVMSDEVIALRGVVGRMFGHMETEFSGIEARMERRLLAREVGVDTLVAERIVPLEERVRALETKVFEEQTR